MNLDVFPYTIILFINYWSNKMEEISTVMNLLLSSYKQLFYKRVENELYIPLDN